MKRFSAFLLAVIFSLQIIPLAFAKKAQTKDEPKYYVSFEGLTLGQGMYVEPTYYTLSEVQELMPDAEITEDSLTAALLTMACLKDKGLEFQYTGDYTTFYLSCIKDIDKGYIDLPQVIVENTGYTNDTTDGNSDEWLGEFDYTSMSGWMITVNDFMITAGACLLYTSPSPRD